MRATRPNRVPPDVTAFVRERGLSLVDGRRTTARLAAVLGLYGLGAAVGFAADHLAVWVTVWVLQGLLLTSSIAVQHEGIHGLLYRSKRLNHFVAGMAGFVMMVPYAVYRFGHLEHHRFTSAAGDTQVTPPYRNVVEYLVFAPLSGLIFMGAQWWEGLRAVIGRPASWLGQPGRRAAVTGQLVGMVVWLAVLVLLTVRAPGVLVAVYWAPLAVFAYLAGFLSLPEHYGCGPGPASPFRTTRSTTSNAIVRWCFWGTNFHAAHHLYPNIPGPRLVELHGYIADRCDHVEPSYLGWHVDLVRQLARRKAGGDTTPATT